MMPSCKVISVLILCHLCVFTHAQIPKKFFRNDYTYFESTENFYKIHTLHKTWQDAKKTCALEGATLFYPEDQTEADVVSEFFIKTQPFHWLYIGASDILTKGIYETIDGLPMSSVYHKWAQGEPNDGHPQNCVTIRRDGTLNDENCAIAYPFACKKTLSSLQWNQPCNMPYMDYHYEGATGKCYKFHLKPRSWSEAYAVCSAELSYLAIPDSDLEAELLVNITALAPKDQVSGKHLRGAVHLGYQKFMNEGEWYTNKGIPLSESGYSTWGGGEPNSVNDDEQCGSMFYGGGLNDIGCSTRCFFICEHDVDNVTFDSRFASDTENVIDFTESQ